MALDSLGSPDKPKKLGSLAQKARGKQLKTARGVLFALGILTILVHAAVFAFAGSVVQTQFDQEINKIRAQGLVPDPADLQERQDAAIRATQIFSGAFILLGVIYIVFGLVVNKYPVPVTALALIFYLATIAMSAVLEPASLGQGVILKIIIIVALVKALQAAIAYQKEQENLAASPEDLTPAYEPQ